MKLPENPPDWDLLFEKYVKNTETFLKLLRYGGSTDTKGRYLHWDKVRYLDPPDNFSADEYWAAMKLARNHQYRPLPFLDKFGRHFQYLVTDQMFSVLHWLDLNASGTIKMEPISSPVTGKAYLVSSLMEEAINSSLIEGAATTREVAKEMLRDGRRPQDHGERMIYNNYLAMQFIRELRDETLTKEMVLELHRILTDGILEPEKAGLLRTDDDKIRVIGADQRILHTPPPAVELEERLKRLCDFANQEEDGRSFLHPILKGIILHFMIGYDHPFVDGNGRTARALFYWYALRHGYWLLEYLSISAVIKEAPQQYVKAYLHTETDDNDVSYFLIHQLETVQKAIERMHAYLARKAAEIESAERLLDGTTLSGGLNERQLAVLEHALKHPGAVFTIEGHRKSHDTSYQTARTDLLRLSDELRILTRRKRGNAFVFVAPLSLKKALERFRV